MPKQNKNVSINIQTTEHALTDHQITQKDLRKAIGNLARIFGTKYPRLFPLNIRTEHIARILYVSSTLTSIENLDGFKRHIKEYTKRNVDDHLFTARTANWLVAQGFIVELEPVVDEGNGKRPDLRCSDSKGTRAFLECKRIRKEKFYDLKEKTRIADLVYQKVPTCDQITIYLHNDLAGKALEQRLDDKTFVLDIHKEGSQLDAAARASAAHDRQDSHFESSIKVEGKFSINIIRKPAVIGAENDFLTVTLELTLEDTNDGVRLPGYAFYREGRSVGVFGRRRTTHQSGTKNAARAKDSKSRTTHLSY